MVINILVTKVELRNIDLNSVLSMVHSLRHSGYVQGEDFDFAYFPEKLAYGGYGSDQFDRVLQTKRVEFYFEDEQTAFLFKLKYQ